jgi:hypothetical protein
MKRMSVTTLISILLTLISTIQPASASITQTLFSVNGGADSSTPPATINVGDSMTVKFSTGGFHFRGSVLESTTAMPFLQTDCVLPGDTGLLCGTDPDTDGMYKFNAEATAPMSSHVFTFSIEIEDGGTSSGWDPYSTSFTLTIVDPNAPVSSSGDVGAARAAAEAAHRAAVITAKATIIGSVQAQKSPTLADYQAADYGINTQATVDRINSQILELQAKTPNVALTESQIIPVIQKESFVEFVSTESTQGRVTSRQLITNTLMTEDYKYKASVLRALKNTSVSDLDAYAKIKKAVDAEMARIQERKDRIAALNKKRNG